MDSWSIWALVLFRLRCNKCRSFLLLAQPLTITCSSLTTCDSRKCICAFAPGHAHVHFWTSCVLTSERYPLAVIMSGFESDELWSHTAHVQLWRRVRYFKHVLPCDRRRLSAMLEQKVGKRQNRTDANMAFMLLNKYVMWNGRVMMIFLRIMKLVCAF